MQRYVTGNRPLLIAAWFGLVTGMAEGLSLTTPAGIRVWNWRLWLNRAAPEILWFSVLFDLLLFTCAALLTVAAGRVLPRTRSVPTAVFLPPFLMAADWLMLSGRIRHSASLLLAAGLAAAFTRWFHQHEIKAVGFFRRTLPWVAAVALITVVGIPSWGRLGEMLATAKLPAAPAGTPNVLVILVDTLRSDHLSTYGYNRATTPNLTAMAKQGVLFSSAFAASSWTLPSHASLLTGRYPHEHRAETEEQGLDSRFPTIAEALRGRGYRTGAFSGNSGTFCRKLGFGRGFLHFEDAYTTFLSMVAGTLYGMKFDKFVLFRLGFDNELGRSYSGEINRHFLSWLDKDHGRPFFAFLNYFDTHDPYLPPEPYRRRFSQLPHPGGIINGVAGRAYPSLGPSQLQGEIDAYDGAISYVDENIGRMFAELKKRGLDRNTIVIVTSDHGESFGEHGLLTHRNALYREVIEVPLIVWWPGHLPSGTVINQPVSNTLLPATIMDLLGGGGKHTFPGPSLAELWTSSPGATEWPRPLAELAHLPFELEQNPCRYGAMKSMVDDRWQYITHQKFGPELYQWRSDPREINNLANQGDDRSVMDNFAVHIREVLQHAVPPAS
jgi:arylsulfatase A-like enzyme